MNISMNIIKILRLSGFEEILEALLVKDSNVW